MMHAKHLCQMPQTKKGDASSLRQLINQHQLINHVSSHMNALQAVVKCTFSRFNAESFDASLSG
jgi:hypothetical protein